MDITIWKLHTLKDRPTDRYKDEVLNFSMYKSKENNALVHLFERPVDLLDCFHKNESIWDLRREKGEERSWQNGNIFTTNKEQEACLRNGEVHENTMKQYVKIKEDMMRENTQMEKLQRVAVTNRRRRVFAEEGDELDIDRFMAGDVEMWSKKGARRSAKRTARIVICSPTSGGTDSGEFIKCMMYGAAMCDVLESAGISTEIIYSYNTHGTSSRHKGTSVAFIMKRYDEPLDIHKLLSCGYVWMFRRFVFTLYQNCHDSAPAMISGGLGMSISTEMAKETFHTFYEADVYIGGGDAWWSKDRIDHILEDIATKFEIH